MIWVEARAAGSGDDYTGYMQVLLEHFAVKPPDWVAASRTKDGRRAVA